MKLNQSKQNILELCFNLNYYEVTNGNCNKPQQPQVQQGGNPSPFSWTQRHWTLSVCLLKGQISVKYRRDNKSVLHPSYGKGVLWHKEHEVSCQILMYELCKNFTFFKKPYGNSFEKKLPKIKVGKRSD